MADKSEYNTFGTITSPAARPQPPYVKPTFLRADAVVKRYQLSGGVDAIATALTPFGFPASIGTVAAVVHTTTGIHTRQMAQYDPIQVEAWEAAIGELAGRVRKHLR